MDVMPSELSVGFRSIPTTSTDKLRMLNATERRYPNRTRIIHEYVFDQTNVPREYVVALRDFWYDQLGDYRTFLMVDWADCELDDEIIGIGDGIEVAFQAKKTYGTSNPIVRELKHLYPGYQVLVNDVVVPMSGFWSETDGLITFDLAPGSGSIKLRGATVGHSNIGFYVPVRFDGDQFPQAVPFAERHLMSVQGLRAMEDLEV